MSTDSHDQTRSSCKTTVRSDEENTFDGKQIKKERSDVCAENGELAASAAVASTAVVIEKRQPATVPAGRFASNGFHGDGDLLQDVVVTKFAALANVSSKQNKIRIMIEDGISEESKARVQEIFSQVERLKMEEKLLLYLKLPLLLTNPSGTVDPLRQPLNPLGNRYEIHQTIMWIKTHLEEDPDVSLPKQEVYDEYNMYCIRNSMKPLSTADFGKVMKQVYPRVRPRRLGTRGNSRYCYAGMRKRIKLDPPTLPKISGPQTEEHSEENITEEMLGAASTLIREWAENLLGLKFPNLSALARHLVDNLCVDTRSLAAVCILCASVEPNASSNKEAISDVLTTPVNGKPAKLREAQLQLQRKLQQREHIKDQKYRHLDTIVQNKEKTFDGKGNIGKGCKKVKSIQSPQGTNASPTSAVAQNALTKMNVSAVVYNRQKKVTKVCNNQQHQQYNVSQESNCDNLVVQSREDGLNNSNPSIVANAQRDVRDKNSRKRANNLIVTQQESSPEKQTKLTEENPKHSNALLPKITSIKRAGKISVILASNSKPGKCKAVETIEGQSAKNCDINSSTDCPAGMVETSTGFLTRNQIRLLQDTPVFKNEKFRGIDTDALDDYLNGGNNSQEQEEELLQYFQQSSSSSSDMETSVVGCDTEQISRSDKVSQLRLILQQNLKAPVITADLIPAAVVRRCVAVEKRDPSQKHNLILPTLLNHPNPSGTRRRVSFETNIIEHVQETASTPGVVNTVPQSPNTRRRIFNFTPISPGPHSPINGRASKSNSANASPFVSPRNTPVPRSRSNLQSSGCRSRAQKTLSRSISCSVPACTSKTSDTFIVPTSSGPESVVGRHMAMTSSKSSEVALKGPSCTAFLDLTSQKQLLINYPSQENLQEIKNVYQKGQPAASDQEITELLHASKHFTNEQLFYRSQSVPLHRMVNPASLMSPISTQHSLSTAQSQSVNPSTNSSVAATPVPSEYNDFGPSIGSENAYLLDDANFMSNEQQFLMADKGITSENISNILTILDEEGQPNLQMLPEQTTQGTLTNAIVLDTLPNTNLNLSEEDILDPSSILTDAGSALQKIIQSRSYPNTPLPAAAAAYASTYTEDSNSSRSYPSTPLHTIQSQEVYQKPGEPMLSSSTLTSLNMQGETANVTIINSTVAAAGVPNSLCRNVADLLEASFLEEAADPETDDLDPLGNFDGLQDMDSLTPLFNEVTEPNR